MSEQIRKALAAEVGSSTHTWWSSRSYGHGGDFKDCEKCQRLGVEAVEKMSEEEIAAITRPSCSDYYSIGFTPPKED